MSTLFQIPRILQQYCGGKSELRLPGRSVRALLEELSSEQPRLYECICDENGAVRRHVNIFVNDDFLCTSDGFDEPLQSGDVVSVFQSVSGG